MSPPTYRFAPSPNGELHLGHAYSALFTFHAAERSGGRFLLRIEDIDQTRCRPEFAAQIEEDLSWLGLKWSAPVRVQSRHLADYRRAEQHLADLGLLYPCFCTRQLLHLASAATIDPDGGPLYSGMCRNLTGAEIDRRKRAGELFNLRLDVEKAVQLKPALSFRDLDIGAEIPAAPQRWGDVVLVRKDIGTTYHMAVVVDDAIQGVTHVTRGKDLFEATHLHRLLQALLDLPSPAYRHHRLISDDDGRKLSKSARDRSLRALREAGVTATAIRQALGFGP